jgi:predicted membrane protein
MGFIFTGIFWGIFFLILGVTIILKTFFNINIPLFRIIFALFFIWIGIKILIGGPIFKSNKNGVVFGEARIDAGDINQSKDEYSIVFGRGTIDLTKIELDKINNEININTIFAYSMIKLNSEIPAVINVDSAFARAKFPDETETSFGSYTYKTKSFNEEKPYFKIKVDLIFGALDIIEY